MPQNNDNNTLYQLNEHEINQLLEAEGDPQKAAEQNIVRRLNYIRNMAKIPINTTVGKQAIFKYYKVAQKNPNRSTFDIVRSLPRQHRDTLSAINTVVPINAVASRMPDTQFKRIVRDAITEQKEYLAEEFQPPAMLMLRRQAIRQFPDGQRVVLYTDNKYGLTFTVPYDSKGRGFSSINFTGMPKGMMAEEVNHNESLSVLNFKDGDKVYLNQNELNTLEEVYNLLNDSNKKIMEEMLSKDRESFDEMITIVNTIQENKLK